MLKMEKKFKLKKGKISKVPISVKTRKLFGDLTKSNFSGTEARRL